MKHRVFYATKNVSQQVMTHKPLDLFTIYKYKKKCTSHNFKIILNFTLWVQSLERKQIKVSLLTVLHIGTVSQTQITGLCLSELSGKSRSAWFFLLAAKHCRGVGIGHQPVQLSSCAVASGFFSAFHSISSQ